MSFCGFCSETECHIINYSALLLTVHVLHYRYITDESFSACRMIVLPLTMCTVLFKV